MLLVVYNTRTCMLSQTMRPCYIQVLALHKGAYLRGFLRYLDETFRIFRATCDQYDLEVSNVFEPQKRSYGQKTVF